MSRRAPLARVGAIKLKLGALVGGGVLATAVVLTVGAAAGLPTWLNLAAAVAVALVVVDQLGTGLTAPLRDMARQAERLASGEPVDPVDDSARDEVGALAAAFNRMAREVAHTDRVRRDLVANVSHELRTPLAALSAVLENVVDGIEPAGPEQLARMEVQVGRLRGLVTQLLDLSQLDAGTVSLERQRVDLRALVSDAVTSSVTGDVGRVEIDVEPHVRAWVDPVRFGQVVVNLVSNALRHGPAGEPVRVSASVVDDVLTLTVADTGPGIDPADASRIFDRFARADVGRASTTGGAGLGLAIVRWIAELHGGSVRVDAPGEPGARLTVEVPVDTPTPTGPAPDGGAEPAPRRVAAGTATAVRAATAAVSEERRIDPLQLLPGPVAGLGRRQLTGVALAATAAALLPLEVAGLGTSIVLLVCAGAVLLSLEERLDGFGRACVGISLGVAAMWGVTESYWVLVPVTLGAVLLAGLGIWGPHRWGQALRALLVGPLLTTIAPVAIGRGVRSARAVSVVRVLVPVTVTGLVVLVFGGLLSEADADFAFLLDAVIPDLRLDETLVLRTVLAAGAALLVATYVLVQRSGGMPTRPWARAVRPLADWAVPLAVLELLFVGFLLVQVGVLYGGAEYVLETQGLSFSGYARDGFGQLVAVVVLVLGVIGAVVRVADDAHRRLRDGMLGGLVLLTGAIEVSAVQRLWVYVEQFGLTRLRLAASVLLLWVLVLLVLVLAAGAVDGLGARLPRIVIVFTGALALAFTAAHPDALVARVNLLRYEATGDVDLEYLRALSVDAAPLLADRLEPELVAVTVDGVEDAMVLDRSGERVVRLNCTRLAPDGVADWTLARQRAVRAVTAASGGPGGERCDSSRAGGS